MIWIGLIATPDVAYAQLIAPLILAGAGVSTAMPAAQNAVFTSVTAAEIGKASGTFNMLRYLGGVFGTAVLVAVFAQAGNVDSPRAFSGGFALAMGAAAGLSLAGALAGLPLPTSGVVAQVGREAPAGWGERRRGLGMSRRWADKGSIR
jgi:MFS family permease